MMDQALKDIIINRIGIIADEQSDRLRRECDRLRADAARRGFQSVPGDTQSQIKELYELYYSNFPRLIIQEMRDVLLKSKTKPSPELLKELKDMVSLYAISTNDLEKSLRFEGIDSAIAKTVIISSPNRFLSEIDLIMSELDNLDKGEGMGSEFYITNYNINAPGGIVQTGNHSTANLITINQNDKADLIEALEGLKIAVNNVAEIQVKSKDEVIDWIDKTKYEISKTNQNRTLLNQLLNRIAIAVQTYEKLKPAYDALKTLLLPIGIPLP